MAYDIEKELRYIRVQMRSQPAIHGMVEQSLETLKALGYAEDKIEAVRREFTKPIGERKPYEVAPPPPELVRFREDLIAEIGSKLNEAIPTVQDSVKSRAMAEKIVDMASIKYSPEELRKITRYARILAGTAVSQYKKLSPELAKPPAKPTKPRKVPDIEDIKEKIRAQMATQWRYYEYYLRDMGESERSIAKEKSKVEKETKNLLKFVDKICRTIR